MVEEYPLVEDMGKEVGRDPPPEPDCGMNTSSGVIQSGPKKPFVVADAT